MFAQGTHKAGVCTRAFLEGGCVCTRDSQGWRLHEGFAEGSCSRGLFAQGSHTRLVFARGPFRRGLCLHEGFTQGWRLHEGLLEGGCAGVVFARGTQGWCLHEGLLEWGCACPRALHKAVVLGLCLHEELTQGWCLHEGILEGSRGGVVLARGLCTRMLC